VLSAASVPPPRSADASHVQVHPRRCGGVCSPPPVTDCGLQPPLAFSDASRGPPLSGRVQASGSTPVAPRDHIDLGMSPLLLAFLLFVGFGVGGGPFLFVMGGSGPGGAVMALILVFPWLAITAVLGIRVLTVLARGGLATTTGSRRPFAKDGSATRIMSAAGSATTSSWLTRPDACYASTAKSSASIRSGSSNRRPTEQGPT
jgi:hypothetical protein